MGSRVVVLSFCLLGLLLAPIAAAEPATFEVTGGLPVRAAGDAVVTTADHPVMLFQASGGHLDWSLRADALRLVEVEHWEEVTEGPHGGHSGMRVREHGFRDADLSLAARFEGFTLLSWLDAGQAESRIVRPVAADADDPAWTSDPSLRVFRLGAPLTVTAPVSEEAVGSSVRDTVFGRPLPFTYEVPADALHLQAADAVHGFAGALHVYAMNAEVVVDHPDGRFVSIAEETLESRSGSIYVPGTGWTGPGAHEERIVRYVQVFAPAGTLAVETSDVAAALFAGSLDLVLDGHLAIPRAVGSVVLPDGAHSIDTERMVVSGTVDAHLAPGSGRGTAMMTGSGEVTYLRLGADTQHFPVAGMVAAGAGLALLAAVAVWQNGGALLPLFSRVAKKDVLDHETRAALYEAVKAEPGVSPHGLVATMGVGWSTVVYHLSVLERNDLVVAVRDGRYRRYFDRTSGRFANGRKLVVSVLKNEKSAAIAAHIRANPGLVQRRIAERFGLAASSVHWHVKRLVDAGLVVKERRKQVVALMPGPAWADLEPSDLDQVAPARRPEGDGLPST